MDKIEYNPELNKEAISIIRQIDGNYLGKMWKNGRLIEVRAMSPDMVLQLLLTHE